MSRLHEIVRNLELCTDRRQALELAKTYESCVRIYGEVGFDRARGLDLTLNDLRGLNTRYINACKKWNFYWEGGQARWEALICPQRASRR